MEELVLGTDTPTPLTEFLRPNTLDVVVEQDSLLGPDGRLRMMLVQGSLRPIIL